MASNQRDEEHQHKLDMRIQRAKSVVEGQVTVGNMKILDKTSEELVKFICDNYNDNMGMHIDSKAINLPNYLTNGLALKLEILEQCNLISDYDTYFSGDWYIDINPAFLTYEDDKNNALRLNNSTHNNITIGNIYTDNGNVIISNINNIDINIKNRISDIQNKIDEQVGSEKEDLTELLNELKELIQNIEDTRHVPQNSGFIKRLTGHFDKHGWFYAEAIELLGEVVIKLLSS